MRHKRRLEKKKRGGKQNFGEGSDERKMKWKKKSDRRITKEKKKNNRLEMKTMKE